MDRLRTKRKGARKFIILLIVFMIGQSTIALAGMDRIRPADRVTLWRGDQVIGVYTQEAPLPEGAIISTEGRCGVKLNGLYLVAEDQSVFSINTAGRKINVFVKQGTVYFKTMGERQLLSFVTPNGQIDVQRIRLQVGFGDAALKGYLAVGDTNSEFGVAEGGAMDVLTDDGMMSIGAGQKIILAQADMDIGLPEEKTPDEDKPAAMEQPKSQKTGWSKRKKITIGTIGGAVLGGLVLGLAGGGGGGDGGSSSGSEVSPSSP